MTPLTFQRDFQPEHGRAVAIEPGVRRVTAPNAGPYTFTGTNSYIVGTGRVAIIDPGPADDSHLRALLTAIDGETLTHILLTHSHRDHSGGVAALVAATGAPTYGFGKATNSEDEPGLDSAGTPLILGTALKDGDTIAGEDWKLQAIATPGHASDHLAFALADSGLIFSGDHVMAWSTSVVLPPDGSMAAYMASLDTLLDRTEDRYLPGHGGPVTDAHRFVRALKAHRHQREAAILARVMAGDETVPAIVTAIYVGLDPQLVGAASLSVLAHLEGMVTRGLVENAGSPGLNGIYRPSRH